MKGFKDTTKTQVGHGYADEVPTRPASSRDVAAAKAVRMITPGKPAAKPQPRVTDAMLRGDNEDKAPGERGAKRFAVGGVVPPRSGGMPAQGKPIMNANDARTAPPMPAPRAKPMPVASRAPLVRSVPKPAERMAPVAASKPVVGQKYELGTNKPLPADYHDDMGAARYTGALDRLSKDRGYKKGGKVVEKGTGEVYASKAAMKKHEAKESKSEQRAERKQEGGELMAGRAQSMRDMVGKPAARAGYAKGGSPKSKWC
jgi:hypothetical protein